MDIRSLPKEHFASINQWQKGLPLQGSITFPQPTAPARPCLRSAWAKAQKVLSRSST